MIGAAAGPAPASLPVPSASGGAPAPDVAADATSAAGAPNRTGPARTADAGPVLHEGAGTASGPGADFAALLALKEAVEASTRGPAPAAPPHETALSASSTPDEVLALLAGSLAIPAPPRPATPPATETAGAPARLPGATLPPGLPQAPAASNALPSGTLPAPVPAEGPANDAAGMANGVLPAADGTRIGATAPDGASGFDSLLQPVASTQPVATGTAAGAGLAPAAPLALPADPDAGFDDGLGARVVWLAEQRIGHAEIRLNPENLGPIDIRVQVDGTRVNTEFHSAHAEVRQALEASVPRLRELLGQHGLQLGQADVGQRHAGGGAAPHEPGIGGSEAETAAPLASPMRLRSRGLVDEYV